MKFTIKKISVIKIKIPGISIKAVKMSYNIIQPPKKIENKTTKHCVKT